MIMTIIDRNADVCPGMDMVLDIRLIKCHPHRHDWQVGVTAQYTVVIASRCGSWGGVLADHVRCRVRLDTCKT